MFNLMAGVKITSVHYSGSGDITKDLLTGQVKVMFATMAPVLQSSRPARCAASPPPG